MSGLWPPGSKCFVFVEEGPPGAGDVERLEVAVPEVLDPQYGMYVWPCAVVLAQYVWFSRNTVRGRTILEDAAFYHSLIYVWNMVDSSRVVKPSGTKNKVAGKAQQIGAGAGLPGIVAAKCGASVILSDGAEIPNCLNNCRLSCQINKLEDVPVIGLTWGQISPDLVLLPQIDIILGSDVFYDTEDFENILTTIFYLIRKNPHALFWTTYQERSADWSIESLLYKWNLKCVHIPLETFEADEEFLAGSNLPGSHTIQMMIITLGTSIPSVT
ncbi:methyltransferase-like protein 23 isoform X2 [Rhincodon typus]|uniref:methyltransferase-like protein 23 isoform X2 n=1 Tax=Rhincodon typus TaxID=259920 RepID=UPI00202F90B3|nr:methyltransferase-like protein 23 isoform X2 [Rhincodon typus]